MQLKWGQYPFDTNSVNVVAMTETQLDAAGVPLSYIQTYDTDGWIYGDGQAAITQKMNELISALQTPYRDLVLYRDDGQPSATILKNAGSIGGVVCVRGPSFTNNVGAEYATQRTFRATFRAEYPAIGSLVNRIVFWQEQIQFIGRGGPRRVVLPALNGDPQEQITYKKTPCRAIQTGRCMAYTAAPSVALAMPLWPGKLIEETALVTPETPERRGNTFVNYPLSWRFEFVGASPFIGAPRLWPN